MKIFSAAQIKACDAYTIHASGITTNDLITRAASRCAEWIVNNLPKDTLFIILCGPGNNGKDGLALTRILHNNGYGVKAFLLDMGTEQDRSPDKIPVASQVSGYPNTEILHREGYITDIPENIVIIDAILD